MGSPGHGAASVRHLSGEPSSGRQQGIGCDCRRQAFNADRGENAAFNALRTNSAIACVTFFHLCSPDLLFGFDSDIAKRNIVGIAEQHPETAKRGVLLRKFGQEVIRHTAGKRIHGTGAVPGGVNKSLSIAERDELLKDAYQMVAWSRDAVHLIKQMHHQNPELYNSFGAFRANFMSMVGFDGSLDLYHGQLRARNESGDLLFDGVDYQNYTQVIEEEVKNWSYMKFLISRPSARKMAGTASARCRAYRIVILFPHNWQKSSAGISLLTALSCPCMRRLGITGRA